mmetsp:Transcript_51590/g.109622  ORF Transcript_51590/g.109622 Transcript_51590/m.109622 type:complete len:208 (-) Transcript_51590:33-656(-)|eukprot:CAMPEP_0206421858 /NCGR_PEP_ID=MMETSP0324_2-20121206/1702_1 /ASSEMBLY_ACC=CAM_ASM_000836 /TAXON_ID=2866 /ORGANISM="Crypthecodinium cohnii, Strain Seligo" /LENGTH=207 /DNA_ID=CAMNT_0053886041 /DNA_START=77 /DNA_END=700 /DNA_ORIENTATION=-
MGAKCTCQEQSELIIQPEEKLSSTNPNLLAYDTPASPKAPKPLADEVILPSTCPSQDEPDPEASHHKEEASQPPLAILEVDANMKIHVSNRSSMSVNDSSNPGKGKMIVNFTDEHGKNRKIDFKSCDLGFSMGLSGSSSCCLPSTKAHHHKAKVIVTVVRQGGNACKLGVKRAWVVKGINGHEVHGLSEAQERLADAATKFKAAAPH